MGADLKVTRVVRELEADAPLISCRFDPSGRHVFATGEDRLVYRWDLTAEDGARVTLAGHESWVQGLAFSPDGETLVTAGYDDTLIWWAAAAGQPEPLRRVKAHEGWIRTVSTSPDGKLLASAGNDRIVRLWNFADGTAVREMAGHERDVYSTVFHPDGAFLLSGDLRGVIHQWEVGTGRLVRSFDAKALNTYDKGQGVDYGGVRSLSIRADGSQVAACGLYKATNPLGAINEPLVLRFDWESQALLRSHTVDGLRAAGWRAVFHPDGFLIGCAGGSAGGFLLFWNAEEDKEIHQFKLKDTARDFDLHPDGIQIATAHHDRKVRISRMDADTAGAKAS